MYFERFFPNETIVEVSIEKESLEFCGDDFFDVIVADRYIEETCEVIIGTHVVFITRRIKIESCIISCSEYCVYVLYE